ncbi:MAG: DUF6894 family protein [Janthinobacterium lividum]
MGDFPGLLAVIEEAQRGIRSLLSEGLKAGTLDLDGSVEIPGEDGVPIFVVSFGDAITNLPRKLIEIEGIKHGFVHGQCRLAANSPGRTGDRDGPAASRLSAQARGAGTGSDGHRRQRR